MKRLLLVLLAGGMMSGCAGNDDIVPGDAVRDEAAAIAIGQATCGAGAKPGWAYNWHAKLSGHNWSAWSGPYYDGHHAMEVKINKATGRATDCQVYPG
jgi:hypothetical protein